MKEIPIRMIQTRMKVASMVPVVLELGQAFEWLSFKKILDRFKVESEDKAKQIAEIIINISDSWADNALSDEGEIVLKDEMSDEPYISDTFPISVEDRRRLRLNSMRLEWLQRWAESKRIAEPQHKDIEGLTEDEERRWAKAISKAEEKGILSRTSCGYDWKRSKVLLAYFCGRLICEDDSYKGVDNTRAWGRKVVKEGEEKCRKFPGKRISELFTINGKEAKNVDGCRQVKMEKSLRAPKGYEEIEECIK